ncbi:cation:proton antiporter [Methanoregula sp.]|uniref:cation:proton antiporter n=1 Tax=Methanoregula sp. TaxID=2052170 RepID=UPI00356B5FF0
MDALLGIIILLVSAKVLGEVVEYLGYPSLIGEIVAGILLGPSVLGLVEMSSVIQFLATLGVILLLFITGIEINQKIFHSARKRMIVTGIVASAVPFVAGYGLSILLSLTQTEALFVAIIFSLTSIGVSVRTLLEERQLNTDFGMTIVGAAIVSAIGGIVLFGVLSAFTADASFTHYTILRPLLIATFFILVISTVGKAVFGFIFAKVQLLGNHALSFAAAFSIACSSALASQMLGLTFVVGAFFAGLALSTGIHEDHDIHETLNNTAFGIVTTIFFASVGLLMYLPLKDLLTPVILVIIIVAVLAKIVGGFLGSVSFLDSRGRALLVGVGMIPRGDLTLALAQSAIIAGMIAQQLYTATVLLVIVTVLVTPFLLHTGIRHLGIDAAPSQ